MQVGSCQVQGELERTPSHVLYRGLHLGSNRPVALRVLLTSSAAAPEVRQRFASEAQALTRLDHPSVQKVLEVGEAAGKAYLVLEPVPGSQRIGALLQQRPEPLPVSTAVQIAARLAAALEHCHAQGVVHRDVCVGSVLLTADGQPVLTEFGVIKDLDPSQPGVAETGRAMGTPGYCSPEQASGQISRIGPAVDVYGLGAVLYTLLVRRTPIQGTSPMEIMASTVSQPPMPPRALRDDVPEAVEEVCLRCLAKEPEERYGTAAEVRRALEGLLAGAEGAGRVRLTQPGATPPPMASVPEEPAAPAKKKPGKKQGPKPRRSRSRVGSVDEEAEGAAERKGLPLVPLIGGAVGLLLLLGIGAAVALSGESKTPPVTRGGDVADVGSAVPPPAEDPPTEDPPPAEDLPPVPPATKHLVEGMSCMLQEDYLGAIKQLDQAVANDPTLAVAYHNRGNAHYRLANYEKALADFDKAVELEPDAPEAHHNRGAAAESLDRYEVAVEAYERFLELSPENRASAGVEADLKRLRKELEAGN